MGWASGSRWYRQKITVSGINVAGDVTDFPVAINIPVGNDVFTSADITGTDILFTADDGETVLDFERSVWNKSGSEGVFYVKTDLLSSSDNEIYIYYGGRSLNDYEDSTGVWSDSYYAVYHFEEPSGNAQDSTSNNRDATIGGCTRGNSALLGTSLYYDGSNDYVERISTVPETNLTVSIFCRPGTSNDRGLFQVCATAFGGGGNDRNIFFDSSGNIRTRVWDSEALDSNDMDWADNQWHQIVMVFGSNTGANRIIADGQIRASGSKLSSDFDWDARFYVGFSTDGANDWFNGYISEFRMSSIDRSQPYLETEYNNLSNNASFLDFAAREVSPYLITTSPYDFPTVVEVGEFEAIGGVRQILTEYTKGVLSTIYYDMPVYYALTDAVSGTRDIQDEVFISTTGTLSPASFKTDVEFFTSSSGFLFPGEKNIYDDFVVGLVSGDYSKKDVYVQFIQGAITTPFGYGLDVDVNFIQGALNDASFNEDIEFTVSTSQLYEYDADVYSSTYSGTVVYDVVGDPWYDYTWPYRQKITVDSALVTANLTDFPTTVKIDDSSHGVFEQAQADGDDIIFTNSSGIQLDHELSVFTDDSVNESDDFTGADGTAPDDTKWVSSAGVQIQSNKLWIETDNTTTYREVKLIDTLKGDFNIEVDYELAVYPSTGTWYHALEVRPTGSAVLRYRMKRQYRSTGGQQYGTEYYNGVSWSTPNYTTTTDTSGKLRLSRTGDTIYAYYWNGSWQLLTTFNGAWSGEIELRLFGWTSAAGTRSGYFDNFIATSEESILVAYVKSDLSSSVDTELYMYYGNQNVSDQSNATAVWTGYQGVYHFEDTDGVLRDSTSAGRDGTAVNGVYGGDRGVLGGSWYFRGESSDYAYIPQATGLVITGTAPKTASTYFMPLENENATPTHAAVLRWSGDISAFTLWLMSVDNNEASPYCNSFQPPDNAIAFHGFGGDTNVCTGYRLSDLSPLTDWYSYSVTYGYSPSNRLQVFWDGQARGFRDYTLTLANGDTRLGGRSTHGFRFKYTELRLFNGAKSPEWLETEHNSIIEIDSFLSFGTEEELNYHWELDDYVDSEMATLNSGTGEGGYLWPFPSDVYSTASGSRHPMEIDLYVSLCNTVPSGQVFKSPEVWPVASGYYFGGEITTSGTLTGYEQDVYVSLESLISGSNQNTYLTDMRLHALEVDNFFLEVDEYTTSAGIMSVDIYDKRRIPVSTANSYFVVSGTQVPVTFSGIEVQTTDLGQPIVASGYRMFFDSPTDFFADEPVEIVAHGANIIGDVIEQTYYLLYGYNLIYDTPPEVVWGWGDQIIVWATAKNKASCPTQSTDAWWFEIRPKEYADLGATIYPQEKDKDLGAKIYGVLPNTFYYGAKVTVIVRAEDEAGNEMQPFVLNFTIEDNPN